MPIQFNSLPTQARLKELRDYDPITGNWTRKVPGGQVNCTAAGTLVKQKRSGYVYDTIDGKGYFVHRLVYRWMTGKDPGMHVIDHWNGNPVDNSWDNLWRKSSEDNSRNVVTKHPYPNTQPKTSLFWQAIVKGVFLGYYRERSQAAAAAQKFRIDTDPNYNYVRHIDYQEHLCDPFIGPLENQHGINKRKPPIHTIGQQRRITNQQKRAYKELTDYEVPDDASDEVRAEIVAKRIERFNQWQKYMHGNGPKPLI